MGQCFCDEQESVADCFAVAERIATKILGGGSGKEGHRVAIMTGEYPHNERPMGGLCKSALIKLIEDELQNEGDQER